MNADVFDALLDELADRIAARLAKAQAPAAREPYDQDHLPPGETRHAYLEKARLGRFPTSKVNRRIICTADDWDAFLASRRAAAVPVKRGGRPPSAPKPANDHEDAIRRDLEGIRLNPRS